MAINNPQGHFVRLQVSGQSDRNFLCVTSMFNYSDYEPDEGVSLSGPDQNGRIFVELYVKRVGDALRCTKSVFHQVNLEEVEITNSTDAQVKLWHDSTLLATVIINQEESETIIRPIGEHPLTQR